MLRSRHGFVIQMRVAGCERLALEHELADGSFVFGDGGDSQVQGVHLYSWPPFGGFCGLPGRGEEAGRRITVIVGSGQSRFMARNGHLSAWSFVQGLSSLRLGRIEVGPLLG